MISIVEIFDSFQGEGTYTGWPMTFVRLAGCGVGCPFCDTDYERGKKMNLSSVLGHDFLNRVCITGGEPLASPLINVLLEGLLLNLNIHKIHIETSGCYKLPSVIDWKRDAFWIACSPKGHFLGAKKDFLPEVLQAADEVKWIYPSTPSVIMEMWREKCSRNFLQPENEKDRVSTSSLRLCVSKARELGWPISLQVHKLVGWR